MMKDVTDDNNDNSNMNSTNNANKSDANDGNEMKDIGNNDDKHNENSNTHHEVNPYEVSAQYRREEFRRPQNIQVNSTQGGHTYSQAIEGRAPVESR